MENLITTKEPNDWRDLQNKVAEILSQSGFEVEIEKTINTARGQVELDIYAVETIKSREYSIICECKHWKSKIPQSVVHSFRTVLGDMGCNIGYIITTNDFQPGTINASKNTNLELLTWEKFQFKFFEIWYETYFSPRIAKDLDPILYYSEPLLPKWVSELTEKDKDLYFKLKEKYDLFGMMLMPFTPYLKAIGRGEIPQLPLVPRVNGFREIMEKIPSKILNETGYIEFMNLCLSYGQIAITEFRQIRDRYTDDKSDG